MPHGKAKLSRDTHLIPSFYTSALSPRCQDQKCTITDQQKFKWIKWNELWLIKGATLLVNKGCPISFTQAIVKNDTKDSYNGYDNNTMGCFTLVYINLFIPLH